MPDRFVVRVPRTLAAICLTSGLAGVCLLVSGCATTPAPVAAGSTAPVAAESTAPPAVTPAVIDTEAGSEAAAVVVDERQADLDRAARLVALARIQARLGLYEIAQETWNEAVETLWPHVGDDPAMISKLREIETERDSVIEAAEAGGLDVDSEQQQAAEGSELVEQIADGPEPVLDPIHLEEVERASRDVTPDYPIVKNDRVLAWMEAYTGNLRDYFAGSLSRSGRYMKRFRQIFAEEGVPQDLVYLAHVESGFKAKAYSRAHAKGIFQFISATGRRYGLVTNWWVDERSDPEKACRASASYLRDLYDEFGDWYLALASYNAGEGRVRRATRSAKSKDFWVLSKKRLLRRETRNYVPAIIAATLISKEPEKFGFVDVDYEQPEPFEIVHVPSPTDLDVLARVVGTDRETLARFNLALRRGQTPPNYDDYPLHVPPGLSDGFSAKLAQVPESERIVKVLHRVSRGDTLSAIARRHGTSIHAIQQANKMGRRTLLKIGRVLEIPRGPASTARYSGTSRRAAAGAGSSSYYRVRRGDTLGKIARRHRMSVRDLQELNRLGGSTRIIAGQRLRVRSESGGGKVGSSISTARSSNGGTHVVRSGDTLWDLSRAYKVTLTSLLQANGLSKRSKIKPGQKLVIPGRAVASARSSTTSTSDASSNRVHIVKTGENLFRIAKRYGTTIERICTANGINKWTPIHPGDQLRID